MSDVTTVNGVNGHLVNRVEEAVEAVEKKTGTKKTGTKKTGTIDVFDQIETFLKSGRPLFKIPALEESDVDASKNRVRIPDPKGGSPTTLKGYRPGDSENALERAFLGAMKCNNATQKVKTPTDHGDVEETINLPVKTTVRALAVGHLGKENARKLLS